MIRSMTGFGEAVRELPWGRLRATVKTVNHRFLNPHLRTPQGFDRFEGEIQIWLRRFFARGHVNLTIMLEKGSVGGEEELLELDLDRARHYRELLDRLREGLDLPGEVDLSALLRVGNLFKPRESPDLETEDQEDLLREVVEAAAHAARMMREEEGARLREDLLERLQGIEGHLAIIERRAPLRLTAERDRLEAAVRELSRQEEVDEDRLAREIAYLAERWDINEEIVRFRAHLEAFRETLAEDHPVGKRLGFLVQEMHREVNTIASKGNDVEIGHASVAVREEIERLREQLENVE